jgi:Leucine-rich repeat (LRR) protein
LIKLDASNNRLRYTFDFDPPANLEWVDYCGNQIMSIQNAHANKYLKYLYLDNNNITTIDGLDTNKCLRVLSLNGN